MEYGNEVINKRTTAHSRISAIGGTREMMREAEFESLIEMLIDSGAVQRSTAARAITNLAEDFRAIALGERDTPYVTNSFDLFWRAHSLETLADKLRK